ncbi:MAG: ABC transporter permease subunit [Oscillospiraceae bacterium]|nr:ABC transporter permease subunit [Oscillospiraceae bacterium]
MKTFYTKHRKTLAITLMMLPGAIWLLLLRYLPMGGAVIAFQNYRPYPNNPTFLNNILNSDFVGFNNFRFIFASDRAWIMIRNTLAYNAVFIVLTTVLAIAIAIGLSELRRKFFAKLYQTLMFYPFFISWVVAGYFVFAFLDPTFGLLSHVRNWYFDPTGWPVILTSANLWKNLGFNAVIYLAAITSIDHGLYEAAAIDGASKWKQVWSITIPSIKPMIIILFILAVGRIFNADIGLFWNIPQNMGPLQSVTEVMDTYVLRIMNANIPGATGMATAAGLFQQVVGFVCIMFANGIVRRLDRESSLF